MLQFHSQGKNKHRRVFIDPFFKICFLIVLFNCLFSLLSERQNFAICLFFPVPCLDSSEFCDSHLRLLFTVMEKSTLPDVRSNLIIAAGDLAIRFPNLVEPWTSHLYAR